MSALTEDPTFQRLVRLTPYDVERATKMPTRQWMHNCHAISLAIVQSGLFMPGTCRVVRGHQRDVGIGQHSWVVVGHGEMPDAYSEDGSILDCSVWSYDATYPQVFMTSQANPKYRPHGAGEIDVNDIVRGDQEPLRLSGLSHEAQDFLDGLGPLDALGWVSLSKQPVGGWPSKEIITAMHHDDRLRALVPIDIVGNLTDENPGDLYW